MSKRVKNDKLHEEFRNFLKQEVPEVLENVMIEGCDFKVDFYDPQSNIAIEFIHLWANSETHQPNRKWIVDRVDKLEPLGIKLVSVYQDEFFNKKELVKKKILHILKRNNSPKIYARQCYVKEIDSNTLGKFLDANHIQGRSQAAIKLGLYADIFDDKKLKAIPTLVAALSFVRPRVAMNSSKSSHDYELARYATDISYCVTGGLSKLFSYFYKNYEWTSVLSYADRRFTSGISNIYESIGFKKSHCSNPSYFYFSKKDYYKKEFRYKYRKQELPKLLESFDIQLTEYQNMLNNNYMRVFDCGTFVFLYQKDPNSIKPRNLLMDD